MFASMWLTKISYVCKPHKIIPFLFVGATAMRGAANKEGNGKGGKGNGDGDKGAMIICLYVGEMGDHIL